MNGANRQALEDFKEGQLVEQYRVSEDGDALLSAAHSDTIPVTRINGIDVVDGAEEEYLFTLETDHYREVDGGDVESVVLVKVYDEDLQSVDEGRATISSRPVQEVGLSNWASKAYGEALSEGEGIEVVGELGSSGSEITDLRPEYEEPRGLNAIDTVE